MKPALLLLLLVLICGRTQAQTVCNVNGNIILYSNYDGGTLNINVDVNIPNLYIGVVSYEAVAINISGTFASNVVGVHYAGYNASNNHCTPNVTNTAITGAGSATTNIVLMPSSTISNSNGNSTIICNTSCNITTNQGGCNTADQIAGYFQTQWPAASIRYHKTQYGCWSGTQMVSAAGNCCAGVTTPPTSTLALNATATAINCFGQCTSTAIAVATGGQSPYTYQWTGGPATATWTSRCAGTYYVSVTDAANTVRLDTVVITQPPLKSSTINQTACVSYNFLGNPISVSGQFRDTIPALNGCDSVIILNLTINPVNIGITQTGGTLTAAANLPATYQWVRCTGSTVTTISGATAKSYVATQNGQYAVIVGQNGCFDTSACLTVSGVGISEKEAPATGIAVYPNPLQGDDFVIEAPFKFLGAEYILLDVTGRTVAKGLLNRNKTTVSVHGIPAGNYLLRIAGTEHTIKLIR